MRPKRHRFLCVWKPTQKKEREGLNAKERKRVSYQKQQRKENEIRPFQQIHTARRRFDVVVACLPRHRKRIEMIKGKLKKVVKRLQIEWGRVSFARWHTVYRNR